MTDETAISTSEAGTYQGLGFVNLILSFWGGALLGLFALQLLARFGQDAPGSLFAVFAGELTMGTMLFGLGAIAVLGFVAMGSASLIHRASFKRKHAAN